MELLLWLAERRSIDEFSLDMWGSFPLTILPACQCCRLLDLKATGSEIGYQ